MYLYRGLAKSRGDKIVAGTEQIAATSNGEFGNGSYYWRDDIAAGVISALQYYGQAEGGWAVLRVTVTDQLIQQQGVTSAAVLNFRPNTKKSSDYSQGYDPGTDTTARKVTVPYFGDAVVKLNFNEFREVNADPEGHGLVGEKNTLTWPNYAIISGPTVACPDDATLTQIKFAGAGIDALNAAAKAVVLSGKALGDSTFARVRNWTLTDRKKIYQTYFEGRATVDLVL